MDVMANQQKPPSAAEFIEGIKKAIQDERSQIGTLSVSLDGIKTQVRVVMEDYNRIERAYDQAIEMLKNEFNKELDSVKKEFDEFKAKQEAKSAPTKSPESSMKDPKKK